MTSKGKLNEKSAATKGMSVIVKTIALIMSIPVSVFGIYIVLHGHLTPGGGFAGGAILATLFALFVVSFGREKSGKIISMGSLYLMQSLGLAVFAILAFLGLRSTFFNNFLANSGYLFGESVPFGTNPGHAGTGGIIPLMDIGVGLAVFAGLSLVVMLMANARGGEKK